MGNLGETSSMKKTVLAYKNGDKNRNSQGFVFPSLLFNLIVSVLFLFFLLQQWVKRLVNLRGPNQQEDIRLLQAEDMEEDMLMSVLDHL